MEKKWRIGAAFCEDYLRSLLNNNLGSKKFEIHFISSKEETDKIQIDSLDLIVVPAYINKGTNDSINFIRKLRAGNFTGTILVETIFRRITPEIMNAISCDKNKKTFWAFSLEIPYTIKKLFSEAA